MPRTDSKSTTGEYVFSTSSYMDPMTKIRGSEGAIFRSVFRFILKKLVFKGLKSVGSDIEVNLR